MPRIPDTQRAAYEDLLPKLGNKQMVVYLAIQGMASTFFELEARLCWPINCITGRVKELVEKKLVKDTGLRRINPVTKKPGIVWGLATDDKKQPDLFKCDFPADIGRATL